jgi:hypothetical protein
MSNRVKSVSGALDLLVPPFEADTGNWDEIIRRADSAPQPSASELLPSGPHRFRGRRGFLLAAAVVLLIVLFATPAFGLQHLVLDLIGRKNVTFSKAAPAPNEIKKQFADLGIGAPPRNALHVLAGQARNAGTLSVNGKQATLWIAPTKDGGYCYDFGGSGGCHQTRGQHPAAPVSVGWAIKQPRSGRPVIIGGSGEVYAGAVARLELVYADATRKPIPFIWVSRPIAAGFFVFGIPAGERPVAVVAYNKASRIVARATTPPLSPIRIVQVPPGAHRPPRTLPAASTVHPIAPLQQASASGVTAVVGANGAVQLASHDVPASVRHLLSGNVSFSCFRLIREFGIPSSRGYGVEGAFSSSIGFRLFGVGRPLDGCEITSERGHRWPDAFGSHAPVELPLTAKGRAYFADRAAARDLALFIRSRQMQQIRKEHGQQLLDDIKTAYGHALQHSNIHYTLTRDGITFTETSVTGRQFRVVIANRRIRYSNLKPYAFVF